MSRKGKLPIEVPTGVEVKIQPDLVTIKGPKGTLEQWIPETDIEVTFQDNIVQVSLKENSEKRNFHGLYRTLIDNMVIGVTKGYEKYLDLIGVGYRAQVQGSNLNLSLGFSHPTIVSIPTWAKVSVEKNTKITIWGTDKQQVGEFAAEIRMLRPPEPYKGKGIRYKDEHVRKKAGKAAAKK